MSIPFLNGQFYCTGIILLLFIKFLNKYESVIYEKQYVTKIIIIRIISTKFRLNGKKNTGIKTLGNILRLTNGSQYTGILVSCCCIQWARIMSTTPQLIKITNHNCHYSNRYKNIEKMFRNMHHQFHETDALAVINEKNINHCSGWRVDNLLWWVSDSKIDNLIVSCDRRGTN